MAGSLFHARRFGTRSYLGNDNREHDEIEVIDGGVDDVSYSSWRELVERCAELGVPEGVWPFFADCEFGIDVPLDEVSEMQRDLRQALSALGAAEIAALELLSRIAGYLASGEQVFYC